MTEDEAIAAIQRAARGVAPAELFAAALLDGVTVPSTRTGSAALAEVYADGDALLAAVTQGEHAAIAAAMRGLARLDGEVVVVPALVFVHEGKGELRRAATFALARSQSSAALDALLSALEPGSTIPRGALDRSVHPDATKRVRAVLLDTGVTMFAVRPRPDLADWSSLSSDEQQALLAMQPTGGPTAELQRAQNAIAVLGARGDQGSLELILRIFESHPDDRLRLRCAHALAAISDPRATAALDRRWADADSSISTIAVRAGLLRDVATAWSRFAAHTTAIMSRVGTHVDVAIVATLLYVLHGGFSPRRFPPDGDPLVIEPRFVDFAVQVRHDDGVGDAARMLLEELPRDQLLALIEKYPRVVKVAAAVPVPTRADFLARYERGEHAAWDELCTHADAIAQHPDLALEAAAVAGALMRRVRNNANIVRSTLIAGGAKVASECEPASTGDLARLIGVVGPLPVALDAFWRTVGSIAFVPGDSTRYDYGSCSLEDEGLSLIALDPLEVCGPDVSEIIQDYEARIAASHREIVGGFSLDFAPDFLHKQDISGGPPYAIELPPRSLRAAVDPDVMFERHQTTLVGYLRIAFAWGGFPLLSVASLPFTEIGFNERAAFRGVKGPWAAPAERLRAKLCRDLLSF
ncbi:MAG: HEAT repeat domain-containing protein [Deltaproteobacteria bacterium]|nr:HEAT repeat domain-containing protein [Deltaproteobacteria bacterium]